MPLTMNREVFITCAVTDAGGTQDKSSHECVALDHTVAPYLGAADQPARDETRQRQPA